MGMKKLSCGSFSVEEVSGPAKEKGVLCGDAIVAVNGSRVDPNLMQQQVLDLIMAQVPFS
jgi:predicted metalloprotease with PDZ domain